MRPDSFADHFSQARQFFVSQTEPEQDHIVSALIFELSKVETKPIRARMLGNLAHIDDTLCKRVAEGLAFRDPIPKLPAAKPTRTDLPPSPALSILAKATPTLHGRLVGCLVTDGADAAALRSLSHAVEKEGGKLKLIAPRIGGIKGSNGRMIEADFQLAGGPSVLFDAVAILASAEGGAMLAKQAEAVAFAHDAFAHLKVIGYDQASLPLLQAAGVRPDEGVVVLDGHSATRFVAQASKGRVWQREKAVHAVY